MLSGLLQTYENLNNTITFVVVTWSLIFEKKTLAISADILYDEYLSTGIETFELSEYKYGKDLQKWFDNNLRDNIRDRW